MTAGDAGHDDASRVDRNRVRRQRRGHRRQGHRQKTGERRLQVIEGKRLPRHPMHIEAVKIAKLHGLVEHRFAVGGDEDDIGGALPIGEELQKLHAVMIGKGEIENDAVGVGFRIPGHGSSTRIAAKIILRQARAYRRQAKSNYEFSAMQATYGVNHISSL